jgi:hypothetical protein
MLNVIYAECHKKALYVERRYAECNYAQCPYAECRSATYTWYIGYIYIYIYISCDISHFLSCYIFDGDISDILIHRMCSSSNLWGYFSIAV